MLEGEAQDSTMSWRELEQRGRKKKDAKKDTTEKDAKEKRHESKKRRIKTFPHHHRRQLRDYEASMA